MGISKLLRFECSSLPAGETISIPEYAAKMQAGQRDIYFLCAPSRQLAETSPYFESMKKAGTEVLFCYEAYDELVLMQLQQFDGADRPLRLGEGDAGPEGGQGQDDPQLALLVAEQLFANSMVSAGLVEDPRT